MKLIVKAYEPEYLSECTFRWSGTAYTLLNKVMGLVGNNYQIFWISYRR